MKKALLNQLRLEKLERLTPEEKGEIVRNLREESGLSYRKLQELTGIPHSTLLDWATGRQKNVAGCLHISIGKLIEHFSVYKPNELEKAQISVLIRTLQKLLKNK